MNVIKLCELPHEALMCKYKQDGTYTDCYFVDLPHSVSHAEYVEVFYTTAVFKIERLILALCVAKPSTDLQAKQLASGETKTFAAWSVEGRSENQLLLCDYSGRTRSWLMSVVDESGNSSNTRLYFGSAVVPKVRPASGQASIGWVFHALLGFHKLYSRTLLRAALFRLLHAKHARQ